MFINTFENSNEYKLKQIISTLKNVYDVELKLNEQSDADLIALKQKSEIIKNSIISENKFNTYNTNPEYTKNILIMEAVHLFLTEIAPKRIKKIKVKENAVPSTPPSKSIKPATTATNSPQTPGTLTVRKGNDTKVIPAAQLAGLQAQGYQVVGADDSNQGQHPVNEGPRAISVAGRGKAKDKLTRDQLRGLSLTPFRQSGEPSKAKLTADAAPLIDKFKSSGGNITKIPTRGKTRNISPELQSLIQRYGVAEGFNDVIDRTKNKISRASLGNTKHYIDNKQFEKHASDHISDMEGPINEKTTMIKEKNKNKLRETDSIAQKLMKMMVTEDQDLAQAQALLAAKSLSDDLLTMAEKISKMSVDDLIPLVDSIRDQFGPEAAESYNSMMKQSLDALLNSVTEAKTTSDNAIIQLQGGQIPGQGNKMGELGGEAGSNPPNSNDANIGEPQIAPEPKTPLGRVKKDELGEAWKGEMHTPKNKKGMWDGYTIAELKSKKEKLMAKKERTKDEQLKVRELNFAIRAKQKNKWGKVKESDGRNLNITPELAALMKRYGIMSNQDDNERVDESDLKFKPRQIQKPETPPVKKKKGGTAKEKFSASELRDIKSFLNDKISYNNLPLTTREKLESMYCGSDCEDIKDIGEKIHSKLTTAVNKGDFGYDFVGYVREGTLLEKNKENLAKKKSVLNPKNRSPKKNEFDFRNLKDKSIRDGKPKNESKVNESAPPGKKAEKFIKDSKESFREKYGNKWQERLYATAWKKFGKKEESYVNAKMQLENNKKTLSKLNNLFKEHKSSYAKMVTEGKVDDPLHVGYGLEGELLINQMNTVKSTISKLNEMIKNDVKNGAIRLIMAEKNFDNINTITAAKNVAPWGVAWKSSSGKNQAKFFESKSDRDYWVSLKALNESKLIDPEHFDIQISKLSNKKV